MKTSNILILSFVALSVVITAVVVNKAVRTVKTASERSADVGESKSGMKELTFNPCHTLHIDGNSKLNVHVHLVCRARHAAVDHIENCRDYDDYSGPAELARCQQRRGADVDRSPKTGIPLMIK